VKPAGMPVKGMGKLVRLAPDAVAIPLHPLRARRGPLGAGTRHGP
jgi:hypothetical protein